MIRTYKELIRIPSFEDRFHYLELHGEVGNETFGFDRYLNQRFYRSAEWKRVRNYVITRDSGCDLAMLDREIPNGQQIIVHHMNPMTIEDLQDNPELLLDPEFLITTTKLTHDAIHYSDSTILFSEPIERRPGDTCLWR